MRRVLPLLLTLLPGTAVGEVPPILSALHAQAWPVAEALAAADPDPLAGKLVTFIRLLSPGQAGPDELDAFVAANPTWPDQDTLNRRYGEALANEPDERRVATLCRRRAPSSSIGLLRCAEAWALAGDHIAANWAAREAWVGLPPDKTLESDTLARWQGVLTPRDQRDRFDRLEASNPDAAQRQLARLDPDTERLDAARLAFQQRDPNALAFLAAVPPALRGEPSLLLAEARYLRRGGMDDAALALWRTALPKAEAATPPDRRAAFWTERDALARQRLAGGDAQGAYLLAEDTMQAPEQAAEAQFLAGWIALRRLHDPARAQLHFQTLAQSTRSAIAQARAYYWLSRTRGNAVTTRADLDRAMAWPTTYYGQVAARAADERLETLQARIAGLSDPPATKAEAQAVAGTEFARAAAILVSWGDPRRAANFLSQLLQPPTKDTTRSLVAQLALRLGLADVAVVAARLAGRDGVVLARSGWPVPVQPPMGQVPSSLALGLMRQESSFDAVATSASGAHGLMQLMPGTAAQQARTLHIAAEPLTDPDVNMRLGTAYLANLLAQFGGIVPYAIAAYNAGPRHVREWIATNGDASVGDAESMVDWIELIPFAETRNYVQRVLENAAIYRAKAQGAG